MKVRDYLSSGGTYPVQIIHRKTGMVILLESDETGNVIVQGDKGDAHKHVGYRSTGWNMSLMEVFE